MWRGVHQGPKVLQQDPTQLQAASQQCHADFTNLIGEIPALPVREDMAAPKFQHEHDVYAVLEAYHRVYQLVRCFFRSAAYRGPMPKMPDGKPDVEAIKRRFVDYHNSPQIFNPKPITNFRDIPPWMKEEGKPPRINDLMTKLAGQHLGQGNVGMVFLSVLWFGLAVNTRLAEDKTDFQKHWRLIEEQITMPDHGKSVVKDIGCCKSTEQWRDNVRRGLQFQHPRLDDLQRDEGREIKMKLRRLVICDGEVLTWEWSQVLLFDTV